MMDTELLSVVDERDRVVNTLPRDLIHASGLRHRAVHILVFNARGLLFLQKRSMKKDFNKGLWDTSAAGHVDAGEEYKQSAIREVEEELGVNIEKTLEPLFILQPSQRSGMEFIQVYQCVSNETFNLNAEEIDEGQWLSTEMVSKRVIDDDPTLTETFKTIWRTYQQNHA